MLMYWFSHSRHRVKNIKSISQTRIEIYGVVVLKHVVEYFHKKTVITDVWVMNNLMNAAIFFLICFFPDINFIVQFHHDGHAYYWDVYVHEYPFWIMDFGFVHSQAIVIECLIGYCPCLFPMRCSISWNKTQTQIITHLMMTSSNGNILPRYWSFVWGIHRSPVNFPHKGQIRGSLVFSLICAWINGRVNDREAGDLRRPRGH